MVSAAPISAYSIPMKERRRGEPPHQAPVDNLVIEQYHVLQQSPLCKKKRKLHTETWTATPPMKEDAKTEADDIDYI